MSHDLWLERDVDGYVIQYGHLPFGHEGARAIPLPPEWLRRTLCVSGDSVLESAVEILQPASRTGSEPETAHDTSPRIRIPGACDAIIVEVSSGHWTKTPHGTYPRLPVEADQVVESWVSCENVKQIDAWSPRLAAPVGGGLEIVPLDDPFLLKRGSKLRIRVVQDGLSVAGADIAYLGTVRGTTDAGGAINIRLRHAGMQYIQATRRVQIGSTGREFRIDTASLCFMLAER